MKHPIFGIALLLVVTACSSSEVPSSSADGGPNAQPSSTTSPTDPGAGTDASAPTNDASAPAPTGCTSPAVACPKGCADLDNDLKNCGSCGYACPTSDAGGSVAACVAGKCTLGCSDKTRTLCAPPTLPDGTPASPQQGPDLCVDLTAGSPCTDAECGNIVIRDCGACGLNYSCYGAINCPSPTCKAGLCTCP